MPEENKETIQQPTTVPAPVEELAKLAPAAQRVVNVLNDAVAMVADIRRVDNIESARALASAVVAHVNDADLREFVRVVNVLAKCRPQETPKGE